MNTPANPLPHPPAPRAVSLLLNVGHAVDHMFLLIFATAVASIAADFGYSNWTDLMPYGVGAFFMFGLGALPAGRLGDMWGRRVMMIIFFAGMGIAAILVALTQNAWQLAGALVVLGSFAAIYHPVGIPMLVERVHNPGHVIGVNGLAGNLGIAVAALVTGFLIKWFGWRTAFALPGVLSLGCAVLFAIYCPRETEAPSRRKGGKAVVQLTPAMLARAFMVMTVAAIASSLIFNFTTNGNAQLLAEGFRGILEDPAMLGALLALVYAVASLTQLVVGRLIDTMPFKPLQLWMSIAQIPLLIFVAHAQSWWLFAGLLGTMMLVFGSIPFTDAMIVRYVDDRLRSRVAGMRLTVAFGISSFAVWLLGPLVKNIGFTHALWIMAGIAIVRSLIVLMLPDEPAAQSAPA